jgi:hypothetical protein
MGKDNVDDVNAIAAAIVILPSCGKLLIRKK